MSNSYTYPNLTALMIFHHEWNAIEVCLKSFKKSYPDGQIILARDTLTPFLPIQLQYLNPELLGQNDAMNKIAELSFDSRTYLDLSIIERMDIVSKQIRRVKEAALKSRNENILFLEYDALVRAKVRVFDGVDLETLSANLYPADLIRYIETVSQRKIDFSGWGFVVGVASKASLLNAATWFDNNVEVMKNLLNLYPDFIVLDFLMPILVHLSGGNVADNRLTTECSRDQFWRWRKTPLLHQYRGAKVSKRYHRKFM